MRAPSAYKLGLAALAAWAQLGCLPDRKDVSALAMMDPDAVTSPDGQADGSPAPGTCGDGKLQGSEQCDNTGASWCSGCDNCQVRNTWKISGEADFATGAAKDGLGKVWASAASGFSVEFWFKPQQLPSGTDSMAMFAVTGLQSGSPAMVVALARAQGKGAVYSTCAYLTKQGDLGTATFLQGSESVKVGVWHHVRCAWVAADKVMKFSQDGEQTAVSPNVGSPPLQLFDSLSWLMLGAVTLEAGKPPFLGELDELRVLTGATSGMFQEFNARHDAAATGTELLLHMDQATGAPRLSDSSAKEIDLKQTTKGGPVFKFEQATLTFLPETCYGFTEAQLQCKPAAQPKPSFCK